MPDRIHVTPALLAQAQADVRSLRAKPWDTDSIEAADAIQSAIDRTRRLQARMRQRDQSEVRAIEIESKRVLRR